MSGPDFILNTLADRGLAVVLRPDGTPALRGPRSEVTPAVVEALAVWRAEIVARLRAAAPREWLWLDGHRYREDEDDAHHYGHADRHPAGALWWRRQGEADWRAVAGRPGEGVVAGEDVAP